MSDIKFEKKGKTLSVVPITNKAKEIFKECDAPDGFEGLVKNAHIVLGWAISHNLSVDANGIPIIIPPLLSPYQPKFPTDLREDWEEAIANARKNFDHLKAIDSFAKKQRQFLYRFFTVPVADGQAIYQIIKVTKTKATVMRCTNIELDEYRDMVLGDEAQIPLAQAEQFIKSKDALAEIFSK